MSWAFVAHRGSANNKTSGTGISMSPSANINVGQVAVVRAVADNYVTVSGASSELSLADSKGNVWTKILEWTGSSGVAADGVTGAIWISKITTQILTTDTITLTLAHAVVAKAVGCDVFSVGAGSSISVAGSSGASGSSTTPSVALSGLTSRGYLWLGHIGIEGPNGDTFTQDTDYANNTSFGTTGSTATGNVASRFGSRIYTGVSDTYNPTLGTSRDWIDILAAIKETSIYDETGKEQVILAAQGRLDTASLLETAKAQTILATQGEVDGFLFSETGLAQTILAVQGKSDQLVLNETGRLAVMLVAQGRTDTAQMNEAAKLEVVLAVQGHSDALSMAETAKTEIILALQGETDGLLYTETGLSQVILVVQGKADHLTINEIAKLAVILVSQGKTDLMQMTEIAKLEIILVTQGKVDVMTLPELGREQVILALQGHQDTQNMLELTKSQVILAVLSESDVLIPGGIYFGILKRWDGSAWVREPLKVYLVSSWQTKPLKQWVGSEWKKVDITG